MGRLGAPGRAPGDGGPAVRYFAGAPLVLACFGFLGFFAFLSVTGNLLLRLP
jgi:hypothetical protein